MTYVFVCASESAFCGLLLLHYHGVVVCAGRDHHCLVRVAAMNTLVVHDVLGVVLAIHGNRMSGKNETEANELQLLDLFKFYVNTLLPNRH